MLRALTIVCLFLAIAIGWSSGTRAALALCTAEEAGTGHDRAPIRKMASHHCDYDSCCQCLEPYTCVDGYCRSETCGACDPNQGPSVSYQCDLSNEEACDLSQSVLCCNCCGK